MKTERYCQYCKRKLIGHKKHMLLHMDKCEKKMVKTISKGNQK